jgi:hypothetical protein
MANTNKVFTKYKDPVNSYPLGEMNLGILKPGRYSGFNIMEENIGLAIRIVHDDLIVKSSVSTDDTIDTIEFGCLFMPNGSIIHNETNIASPGVPFTIDTNIANENERTDFVICEHEYIEVVGGQPPTYFIQKGPDNGDLPVLANPEKQVIIGVIKVAPNGYQFADLTYLPTAIPLPAGMIPQDIVNYISSIISIGYATTTTNGVVKLATPAETAARVNTQSVLTPASVIHLVPTGTLPGMVRQLTDSEVVANTPVPGTPLGYVSPDQMRKYGRLRDRISRAGGSFALTVADNGQELTLEGDGGTTPIVNITIPTGLPVNFKTEIICVTQNINFLADSGITIVVPTGFQSKSLSLGARLIIECVNANATLFAITGDLKVLQPAVSTGLVPMRAAVPYFPASNELTEFDGTGLGTAAEVLGWAICNGQNGTRDLRGQFLVGHDAADALFNNVGDQGGYKDAVVVAHSHIQNGGNSPTGDAVNGIVTYSPASGNVATINNTSTEGVSGVNKNLPPFYTTLYIQRIA